MRKILLVALLLCASASCSENQVTEVVLYSKPGCGPCQKLEKLLEDLKVKFVEGQGDKNAGIEFYPTIVILVDGVEKSRIVGLKTKEEIEKLLK